MSNTILTSYTSFEDVNKALYELATCESAVAKKEAQMNEKINSIKQKYELETAEDRAAKELIEKNIETFCTIHKAEFNKERSKNLMFGTIGFRTGNPTIKLLNRKYNWKTVLELAKKIYKKKYVRIKEELDKETILIDYSEKKITDESLAGIGVTIDQGETFKIDINWETIESSK